ncbi:hypothetical protein SAMN05216551_102280 [Chitinasiproducens palmae]|uniref:Uncharacterized protein n=1 Tax=Chitinasiproducens palmae TaxID=1770053 RepID=A0A1H2PKZ6_9BURK|nr:hypothetical protein SAMN05216551_102280 [Chitinasiproducens palmae]
MAQRTEASAARNSVTRASVQRLRRRDPTRRIVLAWSARSTATVVTAMVDEQVPTGESGESGENGENGELGEEQVAAPDGARGDADPRRCERRCNGDPR